MSSFGLSRALGHAFADERLFQLALTHRSFAADHNERLEFIGDSVLNCVVALELYRRFPQLPEGDLSRLRAHLVRQDSLHKLALQLSLGKYLRLGEGELRSGGQQRPSILADALEALIGAVHLDAGFDIAAAMIERLYANLLDDLVPGQILKDAKTRLQEWLQCRKKALPRYSVQETSGAAHEQNFAVYCEIDGLGLRTLGQGGSRRAAEQDAAAKALKELEK